MPDPLHDEELDGPLVPTPAELAVKRLATRLIEFNRLLPTVEEATARLDRVNRELTVSWEDMRRRLDRNKGN